MYLVRLVVTCCWLPACSVCFSDPGDRLPWSLLRIILSNLQVHVFTKRLVVTKLPFGCACCGDFSDWFLWSLLPVLVPVSENGEMYTWGGVRLVVTFRFESLSVGYLLCIFRPRLGGPQPCKN